MIERSGDEASRKTSGAKSLINRREFLGTGAATAGVLGLAGCLGEDRPEISLITASGAYNHEETRAAIREAADVDLTVSSSSSSRIRDLWEAGDRLDDWDVAIVDERHARDIIDGGHMASTDDLSHLDDMRPLFEEYMNTELVRNGDIHGIPIDLDWHSYGYDNRELDGHSHSWSTLFSEEVDGVDLRELIAMSDNHWVSIVAIANYLGFFDSLNEEPIEFTEDEVDQIYDTAMEQQDLLHSYVDHEFRGWAHEADEAYVVLLNFSRILEFQSRWGVSWPSPATPETTVVEFNVALVSSESDELEGARDTADALAGPLVGAGVGKYGSRIGASENVDEHLDEFINEDAAQHEIGFETEGADLIRDVELPEFDTIIPRRTVEDDHDDYLEDLWDDEIMADFVSPWAV